MCDALDELRKDPYSGDCEASVKTRWIESESVLFNFKGCSHLKDAEVVCVVRFRLFELLRC